MMSISLTPLGFSYPSPITTPLKTNPASLVSLLGVKTKLMLDGQVIYNEPLVQRIVNYKEQAIPSLKLLLQNSDNTPTIVEALHTASIMADQEVQGLSSLYPALRRFNGLSDPLISVHLSRFYSKINEPDTFGPSLSRLIEYSDNYYPASSASKYYNISEEAGRVLVNQIARRSAQETVKALLPFLRTPVKPFTSDISI